MYSRLQVRFVGVTDRIFNRLHSGSVQANMMAATSEDFEAELSIVGSYFCKRKIRSDMEVSVISNCGDWRNNGHNQLLEHCASA
jgi:hypothetical protein